MTDELLDALTTLDRPVKAWQEIRCPFCRKLYLKWRGCAATMQLECRCRCKTQFLVTDGKVVPDHR